jgi:hypothetical protein
MATSPRRLRLFTIAGFSTFITAGILALPAGAVAQEYQGEGVRTLSASPAKIWEDRGPIAQLDLFWGNANPDRVPVGPFTFIAEDVGGTNPKARVRDANGVLWGVKWDEEVHSEIAATRLAWAMGLRVDEDYYVDTGTIVFPGGRPAFQRIGSFIDKQGGLKSPARFKRLVPDEKTKARWPFAENPLKAEGGYSVLVLMNVIMANWDAKDDNNKLLSVADGAGRTDWYMVGDYGACFGKMGGRMSGHSKYRLKDFLANPPVIKSVNAGASEQELHGFAEAVYGRIREVVTRFQ